MPPSSKDPSLNICVRGARAHNLKNIQVGIPRDSFTVITGPSGSGKSSLAFDTIYAEGQRRYVESLSVYARQFLDVLSKPEVESIEGLSPTISIEQRTTSYNPRSTVGTVTEVYDYLRLLYARVAKAFCYSCGRPIESQSQQQIIDYILSFPEGSKISILAPIVQDRKGEHKKELLQLRHRGFVRVRIDGEVFDLSEEIKLDRNKKHHIDLYVHRLILKGDRDHLEAMLSDSVEMALKQGSGSLILETTEKDIFLSEKFACTHCNISYPDPEPKTFSFNSPMGACPECDGIGRIDWEEEEEGQEELKFTTETCHLCHGSRLRKESLHYRIQGKGIVDLCSLSVVDLKLFFQNLKLTEREQTIADRSIKEILSRLDFLERVGVSYLSLDRPAQTLSGGEAQRIRLATQIGSSLVDVIYVLDEPSIGLHPSDHQKLLNTLKDLRDLGNTVLVVEHDRETIEEADWVVDLGPGAGVKGGEIVASGNLKDLRKNKKSLTGKYLAGNLNIPVPKARRPIEPKNLLTLRSAKKNNLKSIDISFPLGTFICVTGVSGSGKSTLIMDTLYPLLMEHVYGSEIDDVEVSKIEGLDGVDKVVDIDQRPIGKTPRSNPATYTGIFSLIRHLFSQLPESQVRGYPPGRFSFNVSGGRCEDCEGDGVKRIEMHFLPDVFVKCDTCHGARYNRDTLDVRYKGKNIAEVLEMTATEAYPFFDAIPQVKQRLKVLNDVGLGYLTLGQSSTTLSGGEAQRIKLTKELSKRSTGKTVYILDEPTTGLHFDDVRKLIQIIQRLTAMGNTVIVIEHNLDVIKCADHLIDLGPGGGTSGGEVVAQGTPEEVTKNKKSLTGKFLKGYL